MKPSLLFISSLMTVIIIGCKNPEAAREVVYFTGTETSNSLRIAVENTISRGISVRSSSLAKNNISIDVEVNPSLLDRYNEQEGTSYKPVPEGSYSLSAEALTIPSGGYISDPITVEIKNGANFNDIETYCLPITISRTEGSDVLESSRTLYLIVNKVITTKAVDLRGNYFTSNFTAADTYSQLTLEARVYVNSLIERSPYINSIMGVEEDFLLRIGNVDQIPRDVLEVSVNPNVFSVPTPTAIPLERWFHVAATYDSSAVRLYINGREVGYKPAGTKGPISLNSGTFGVFAIGESLTVNGRLGRTLDGYISEARVWARRLSQREIEAGMCAVDPASKDLLAYWRFDSYKDDQNMNVIPDVTGHGHDAISNSFYNTPIEFVDVKCPEQ